MEGTGKKGKKLATKSNKSNKSNKSKKKKSEDLDEEGSWESFRRIVGEDKDKGQIQVEWNDGELSWISRDLLEGQAALEEWDNAEVEDAEIICDDETLKQKVATLASWMKDVSTEPRRIVFHIGAGFSAEDGVPTFRGKGGLWTRQRVDISNFDLATVKAGYTYKAIVALEKAGFVYWVVTQNYDGLFRRAGFPPEKLSEVHGNIFLERCSGCAKEYYRDFPVEREDADGEDHTTGRNCDECGKPLEDILVHFGEQLRDVKMANAKSKGAIISVAIGTKLMVTPASTWVFRPHQHRPKGKVAIVNAQSTPSDDDADLVVHHKAGAFMRELCAALGVHVHVDADEL